MNPSMKPDSRTFLACSLPVLLACLFVVARLFTEGPAVARRAEATDVQSMAGTLSARSSHYGPGDPDKCFRSKGKLSTVVAARS